MFVEKCYNCSSKESSFYAHENGYNLVKCDECGLLYVNNPPGSDEILQAHLQGEHRGEISFNITGDFTTEKIPRYIEILNNLYGDNLKNVKSWLDIGCGHGEFLIAVQTYAKNNINVTGSEPNIYKQKSAQERGLNVSYFDLGKCNNKYDVISILNVFSHLPDPVNFIKLLKGLLKNGSGELIIQTGDTANFSAKHHHRPFYLPDHLCFASERIIVEILENIGFEIVMIKKYPFIKFEYISLVKELVKYLLPNYKSKLYYYLHWKMYSESDMFIRAKRKSL